MNIQSLLTTPSFPAAPPVPAATKTETLLCRELVDKQTFTAGSADLVLQPPRYIKAAVHAGLPAVVPPLRESFGQPLEPSLLFLQHGHQAVCKQKAQLVLVLQAVVST